MITEKQIRNLATNESVYQRGCKYYKNFLVKDFSFSENRYRAHVAGSDIYPVQIKLSPKGEIESYQCACPASFQYPGACKHVVALLKRMQETAQSTDPDMNANRYAAAQSLFKFFAAPVQKAQQEDNLPTYLTPSLHLHLYHKKISAWLEFTIGQTRRYIVRDVEQFLQALLKKQDLPYGREFTLSAHSPHFTPLSAQLCDLLLSAYEDEVSLAANSQFTSKLAVSRTFILSASALSKFLTIMKNTPFDLTVDGRLHPQIQIKQERPPLKINLQASTALQAVLQLGKTDLRALDGRCRYLLFNYGSIYHPDEAFTVFIKPILEAFQANGAPSLPIASDALPEFFGRILPELEKIVPVKVSEKIMDQFDLLPLEASIYFDEENTKLWAKLIFCYGDRKINPLQPEESANADNSKILIRDQAGEAQLLKIFHNFGFETIDERFCLQKEEKIFDFFAAGLQELEKIAELYYADTMQQPRIQRLHHIKAGINITHSFMLELTVEPTDFNYDELMEILSSYRLKKRYHRLKSGVFVSLENKAFTPIAAFLQQTLPETNAGTPALLPLSNAFYLDSLANTTSLFQLNRSSAFSQLLQDIQNPQTAEEAPPPSLQPILRDYQKTGFKWLKLLARYKFGGILADDMGLGKTLQAIAFLLSEQAHAENPSLIVAPTSLIYNWQEEIERYAPAIKALVIAGQRAERGSLLETLQDYDVVITTYNILKRDLPLYKNQSFSYCILDEAQQIKNPNTQNAQAVKSLKANVRFALTGTPIENTLTELWSIFDFLMPGYLLSHSSFKKKFEQPIVKNADAEAYTDLNRRIAPFILRRLKSDVLTELPPKIESQRLGELSIQQQKVYHAYFCQARREFQQEVKKNGLQKSHIKILSLLTRLRQICCHPSLFIENYSGGSGKLDLLMETLDEALGGGHRVLVFSQFTAMLAIIRHELEKSNISYYYLDGSTPSFDRLQMANEFNDGKRSVFLISLKAGGTGLNLTGADTVIHYDPWWNPAVEDQATDRAYRLGQNRSVQVLKFLMKDTIEEKIFLLQQRKKALIDQIVQPGETFISKLNETELCQLFELEVP